MTNIATLVDRIVDSGLVPDVTKKTIKSVIDALLAEMQTALANKEPVLLTGVGTIKSKIAPARTATTLIPALDTRRRAVFRPSASLKTTLKPLV